MEKHGIWPGKVLEEVRSQGNEQGMTWVGGVGRCAGGQRMEWEGWVRLDPGGMLFVVINIIIKALGRIFQDPRYFDSYMFLTTKNPESPKN